MPAGDTAVPRPGWTPGGDVDAMARWLAANRRPGDRLPTGYRWEGDQVVRDTGDAWTTIGQIGRAAGFGAMGYGAGAGMGLLPIAGSGAAGAATTVPALPTAVAGLPAAGGTGAAAAGGGGLLSMFSDPVSLGILGGSTLLNYLGARNQANASREASQIQQQAVRDAMAAQGQMFGYSSNALLPYVNMGGQAATELGNRLGFEGSFTPMPSFMPPGTGPAPTNTPMPGGSVPFNAVGRVPMESPDGSETAWVDPSRVQGYLARGGRVRR
jgi:hypothetical protein